MSLREYSALHIGGGDDREKETLIDLAVAADKKSITSYDQVKDDIKDKLIEELQNEI